MANIMTKRGQHDNVVTYQHFCDTTADLANIEQKYCTLGSIAIVLQGDSGGLQIYIANSDKQWNPLTSGIGGGNSGGIANLPLEIVNPSNDDVLTYDSTSEKWVNKTLINNNSGGGYLKLTMNQETGALDKTWKEIYDAFSAGYYVSLITISEENNGGECYTLPVSSVGWGDGAYRLLMFNPENLSSEPMEFLTNSENGYPVVQAGS